MKIKFLGTGASEGAPALFCQCDSCKRIRKEKGKNIRRRSGLIIDDRLMIDFGPDTFLQMVEYDLDLTAVETVAFTHSHSDHFSFEDLLNRGPYASRNRKIEYTNVYGNEAIVNVLQAQDAEKRFLRPYTFTPNQTVCVGEYQITPLLTQHAAGENSYVLLVQKGEQSYLHFTDSGYPSEELLAVLKEKCTNLTMASLDCTFSTLDKEFYGHMNLNQNVKLKARLIQEGIATENTLFYATHIFHLGALHDELYEAAKPYGISVAYDGLEVNI